jgi:hypothetical protein
VEGFFHPCPFHQGCEDGKRGWDSIGGRGPRAPAREARSEGTGAKRCYQAVRVRTWYRSLKALTSFHSSAEGWEWG